MPLESLKYSTTITGVSFAVSMLFLPSLSMREMALIVRGRV